MIPRNSHKLRENYKLLITKMQENSHMLCEKISTPPAIRMT